MKSTERQKVLGQNLRARLLSMSGTLNPSDWEQTLNDFGGMCAYCTVKPYTVLEHFIRVEEAGTTINNCVPACVSCNMLKAGCTEEQFTAKFGPQSIQRVKTYLAGRVATEFQPLHARSGWKKVTSEEPSVNDPYRLLSQATEDLSISMGTLRCSIKKLSIRVYKFKYDQRKFLAASDIDLIRQHRARGR